MTDSNGAELSQWMVKETLAEHLAPLLTRYDVKWRGHGVIYVDHEQYNISTAHRVLTDLSASLGVPVQLVRSRLVELGWFNDVRNALPVQDRVVRMVDDMKSWEADEEEEDDFEENEEYDQD
ncbi:hypothetical protein D3C71_878530 [compost metagenome]